MRSCSPLAASFVSAASLVAQTDQEFLPGTVYDPAIPAPARVLGYAPGEEISLSAEVERYLQALAAATPRVRLFEYGKSCQNRPLWYAVVASEANQQRLTQIQAGMQQLADPRRVDAAAADALAAELPAVAWLAYCVHGDEPSGTDAALQVLWHLAAAQNDPVAQSVLANCVVIVDPVQNPDGRDRFVHGTRAARGRWPDAEPLAAEHSQPWPGGRTNHALFDMNRDWFALSQPETRARVAAFQRWWPLVYADLHEMGGNSTYFFAPPSEPLNPEITADQRDWLLRYGRNNAAWFDRFGIDYFTRENYDSFYPGYGEGWPTFHGSIGMTFEQGSSRGLVFRRDDESLLHYRECVRNHFLASLGTLETLAQDRAAALRAFLAYRRSAIAEGETGPVREYVFPDRGDRPRIARLMELLAMQGITVERATGELRNGRARSYLGTDYAAQTFAAGAYVVSLAQPAKRLAAALLERHFEMDPRWLAEQKRRETKRLDTDFYDLTGWSLPLLFDVETWVCAEHSGGDRTLFAVGAPPPLPPPGGAAPVPPKVAWLVPWGNGAAELAAELVRHGIRVRCMDKPFRLGGRDFAPGTFVVRVETATAPKAAERLALAQQRGVEIVATDTSWVESGIHFGSNYTHVLRAPKVAIAWDRPANANSTGWARYLLEQRYGVPATPVRTHQLGAVDLDRFTVLVLPDGDGWGTVIGKNGASRIKQWVERGGVLITLGRATRWLTEDGVALLATKAEDRSKPKVKKDGAESPAPDQPPAADQPPVPAKPPAADQPAGEAPAKPPVDEPFDYQKAIQPDKEPPPRTPGAILRVELDAEHWLAFGYPRAQANVVSESSDIYTPVKLDAGTNVGIYAVEKDLLLSGFVFDAAKKQLAQKAYLVHQPHGKGHVVAFAEDPNLRAFADGLNLLFVNAVLLGPGR
jgi:hypothetical protein